MIEQNAQHVLAAFDVLLEEIEEALRNMNSRGAHALEVRDYDGAQTAIERARRVMMLCEKVVALKGEWKDFERACSEEKAAEQKTHHATATPQKTPIPPAHAKSRPVVHQEARQPAARLIAGRIRKGLRTPEPAFFCPILQALSDLGGSAKRSEVFLLLEYSMRDVLKPIDYHILSSEAEQMRWQNSAQWARNLMVKEGLLRADSSVGIWEITEKGRVWLMNKSH